MKFKVKYSLGNLVFWRSGRYLRYQSHLLKKSGGVADIFDIFSSSLIKFDSVDTLSKITRSEESDSGPFYTIGNRACVSTRGSESRLLRHWFNLAVFYGGVA